jgi:hypothetical protein
MASSVPRGDRELYLGLKAIVKWVKSVMAAKGYDAAFVNDELEPGFKAYETAYLEYEDKEHRTKVITNHKNETKKVAKALYYEVVRQIKGNSMTTDAERIDLNIAPNARTAHAKIPVTDTSPVVEVDTSEPMRVVVTVKEKGKKDIGKPDGGRMWEERWIVADEYTSDIEKLTNFAAHSTSRIEKVFTQEQRGKVLLLAVRWVSPSGEEGKWSVIIAVYIP